MNYETPLPPKEIAQKYLSYYLDKIFTAIGSRKLWAAIAASVVIVTNPDIPPEAKAYSIAGVWAAYVVGTAVEGIVSK